MRMTKKRVVKIFTSCLPSTLQPTRLRQRTNGFARRSPCSPIQNLIKIRVMLMMVKMVITDGEDDCHPHDLTIREPIPDREVPNGEHPVHIDLKVLGVKPVSLARLDLHIMVIISFTLVNFT